VPLNQVGVVDLLDEGSGGTAVLEVKVQNAAETITYLDYVFTGSGTSTSFNASVTGTVSNGLAGAANKTLTFTVSIAGSASSVTFTCSYSLNNPAVTVQETVTAADDGSATTLTLNFTFTRPGETVSMTGSVAVSDSDGSATFNFSFKINGALFATLSGTSDNPVITRAGGGQLTAGELDALASLFIAGADLTDQVNQMFGPAQQILGF
jgi:hypothetical protein